jgi:hypothetical protein
MMNNEYLDLDMGADIVDNQTSDDYYTPPSVFEALGLEFDLDVAAPVDGIPWLPAKKHYSIIDDGLVSPWHGLIWCNPPYSNTTPWARKMIEHNNGVTLVPLSKSAWFNEMWEASDAAVILSPRLKFIRANGSQASIFMPVMLHGFGPVAAEALKNSGLGRVR